ncbi:hypothetical protein YEP4_05419 [Yersinia enterocolitica subsp. palearctica YE-P4]|uniref:Uncharacterized protein n=5 Tax=Yersinia enterocolitica W22703 TaxID=913028 RepID=F4MUI7_YEREN|nr:hypothetical protein YEP4_05419 [Yersinia enterocolitica subsp. palearctica YE-P4]CBX69495.1 unknown protein [Yersinia enterocolitica W22703]
MMTGSTGLHANQARFKLHEKREEFIAGEFLLKNSLTVAADTMKLENIFCQVDTKSRYFHVDAPSSEF